MNEDLTVIIYALHEPGDPKAVRYVGKTQVDLELRYAQHLRETNNTEKCFWVQELRALGLRPGIRVVEILKNPTEDEWNFCEVFWVSLFKEQGCKLVNSTVGGAGTAGTKWKEESKKAMAVRSKGSGNNAAKFTDERVLSIRAEYAAKKTPMRVLATRYGVSVGSIHHVISGKVYANLLPDHKLADED